MIGKLCSRPMGNTDMMFSFPSQNPRCCRQTNISVQWLIQKCLICSNRTFLVDCLHHTLFTPLFKHNQVSQPVLGGEGKAARVYSAPRYLNPHLEPAALKVTGFNFMQHYRFHFKCETNHVRMVHRREATTLSHVWHRKS